jgi:hypothetical protein
MEGTSPLSSSGDSVSSTELADWVLASHSRVDTMIDLFSTLPTDGESDDNTATMDRDRIEKIDDEVREQYAPALELLARSVREHCDVLLERLAENDVALTTLRRFVQC